MKKISLKLLLLVVLLVLSFSVVAYCHEPPETEGKGTLEFSGYLNIETNYSHFSNEDGTNDESSDVYVDEFGINFSGGIAENLSATGLILYEEKEDDSLVTIDEAYLTYKHEDFYGKFGKSYLPLWCDDDNFETNFIVDSYTHNLGETRETVIAAGAEIDMVNVEIGAFNGDSDKISAEDKNKINDFFAAVEIVPIDEKDGMKVSIKTAYVSDITDTDAELFEDSEGYDDRVGGYCVCLGATAKTGSVIAEYVSAESKIKDMEDAQPNAINIEVATTLVDDFIFAVKYEASEDFESLVEDGDTKLERIGGLVGYTINEYAKVKLEYLRTADDADNTADSVTAQVGLEF